MSKSVPQLTVTTAPDLDDELLINQDGVPRRITSSDYLKLLGSIPVNGVLDGTTDDTAAFVAAITEANAASPKKGVLVSGNMKFTPTASMLKAHVPIYVFGQLKPTTTITLPTDCMIIGLGGSSGITSQAKGPLALISRPTDSTTLPTIRAIGGAGGMLVENIDFGNCYIAVHAGDPYVLNNTNGLVIRNIMTVNTTAGGGCILIDRMYWVWIEKSILYSTNGPNDSDYCIKIVDTGPTAAEISGGAAGGSGGYAGLIYVSDIISNGQGIHIEPEGSRGVDINFRNYFHEGLSDGNTLVYARGVSGLVFDNFQWGDSEGTTITYDLDNCSRVVFRNEQESTVFESRPASMIREGNPRDGNTTPNYGLQGPCRTIITPGEIDTAMVSRVHRHAPQPMFGTGAVYAPTSSGNFTITSGQLAPDGSSTAYLVSTSVTGSLFFTNTTWDIDGGDFLVFGGAAKAATASQGLKTSFLRFTCAADMKSLTYRSGTNDDDTTLNSAILGIEGTSALQAGSYCWSDAGWRAYWGIIEITGARTATPTMQFGTNTASGQDWYLWKPWTAIIPAELGMDRVDIIHWLNEVGVPPADAASGTIALHANQVLRTGLNTTVNRPSASAAGAGAQFYDTTLNKPIWSTGSVWKDAAGTTV